MTNFDEYEPIFSLQFYPADEEPSSLNAEKVP